MLSLEMLLELEALEIKLLFSNKLIMYGNKLLIMIYIMLQLIGSNLQSTDSNFMLVLVMALFLYYNIIKHGKLILFQLAILLLQLLPCNSFL